MAVTRSFTVFRDEPSESSTKPKKASLDVLSSADTPSTNVVPTSLTTSEKENLHPVTGLRTTYASDAQTKKRKNSVLATKLFVPPTSKKQKESSDPESKPEAKKRKVSSATAKTKSASSRKDSKASSRKSASATSSKRKVAEMPKVDEEEEVEAVEEQKADVEGETVNQASIDAKCYDLTVSPLADVSKAYDEVALSDVSGVSAVKSGDKIVEATSLRTKPFAATISPKKSSSKAHQVMTTPERRSIYANFTFSSPSPSSKRFASSRAGSFDMFGDIEFKPT